MNPVNRHRIQARRAARAHTAAPPRHGDHVTGRHQTAEHRCQGGHP